MKTLAVIVLQICLISVSWAQDAHETDITKLLLPAEQFRETCGEYVLAVEGPPGLHLIRLLLVEEQNQMFLRVKRIVTPSSTSVCSARIPLVYTNGGVSVLFRIPLARPGVSLTIDDTADEVLYYEICTGSCPPNSAHFSGGLMQSTDPQHVPKGLRGESAGTWIMTRVGDLPDSGS